MMTLQWFEAIIRHRPHYNENMDLKDLNDIPNGVLACVLYLWLNIPAATEHHHKAQEEKCQRMKLLKKQVPFIQV